MATRNLRKPSQSKQWANEDTALVNSWLTSETALPILRQIVAAWNEGEGLGIELADELEDLVRLRLSAFAPPDYVAQRLRNVKWTQLAAHYALRLCGVSEIELSQRRAQRLQ